MGKMIIVTLMVGSGLCATEDTLRIQRTKITYNQTGTQQLQKILDDFNDCFDYLKKAELYEKEREKIKGLVCAGADPSGDLLLQAVKRNDIELVSCCLEHGASVEDKRLIWYVHSVPVLECLAKYNVDFNYAEQDGLGLTLLHHAASRGESTSFMTALCNTGVNTNAKDTDYRCPLRYLVSTYPPWKKPKGVGDVVLKLEQSRNFDREKFLENIAILFWYGAIHNSEDSSGRSPLSVIRENAQHGIIKKFEALVTIVPRVKEQHQKEYSDALAERITRGPACIVRDYNFTPSWGEKAWNDSYALLPPP